MNKLNLGWIILALLTVAWNASAENESTASRDEVIVGDRGYAGLLVGGNTTTNESKNNITPTIGLTLGAKMTPSFGIGLFGNYYERNRSSSILSLPVGTSTKTFVVTGQGNFFIGGFHFGGEAGFARSSWEASIGSLQTGGAGSTIFVYGPEAGFDLKLAKTLSIGVEGHYLFSRANSGVSALLAFAGIKVWM